jgi:hypothetical protein
MTRSARFVSSRALPFSLTILVSLFIAHAARAEQIYFADLFLPDFESGSVRHVGLDGSGLDTLLPIGGGLRDVAVDAGAGKLYWSDVNNFAIRRSNLDGSGAEDVVTTDVVWPAAIALDPIGGKVYWGDQVTGELRRANFDGSENELLLGTSFHRGIALDLAAGKIFWSTDLGLLKGDIRRCNLDGSGQQIVISSLDAEFKPSDIAIDPTGGKIYWTDYVVDIVRRGNMTGGGIQDLFFPPFNNNPRGITLDLAAGKIYWGQDTSIDGQTGKIMRMNLDGSQPQDVALDLGLVNGLALGPEPTPAKCQADLNDSGAVDGFDLGILLAAWGNCPNCRLIACLPDLNGDCVVNGFDLALLLGEWGPCR